METMQMFNVCVVTIAPLQCVVSTTIFSTFSLQSMKCYCLPFRTHEKVDCIQETKNAREHNMTNAVEIVFFCLSVILKQKKRRTTQSHKDNYSAMCNNIMDAIEIIFFHRNNDTTMCNNVINATEITFFYYNSLK